LGRYFIAVKQAGFVMKNAAALPAVLLFAAGIVQATPSYTVTVNDPFANGDACASTSCDVVANGDADRPLFDIQKAILTVSGSTVTMDLYFDFGTNNTNLNQFSDAGVNLNVGDLFFTVGGNLAFVAPLVSHNGSTDGGATGNTIVAGDLYSINNANGVESAQTALNNPGGVVYRNSSPVWGYDNGAGSLTQVLSNGVETLVGGGDGVTNPKFHLTLSFNDASAATFAADAANQSGFGFSFASATCANDIISGTGSISNAATPEPMSLGLVGAGLIGALVWGRRKQARA
jgi:hypothetical protein